MADEPIPLRPYCPSCERPAGNGHLPDCEFMAELERWFMEAAGLRITEEGGLQRWIAMTRKPAPE